MRIEPRTNRTGVTTVRVASFVVMVCVVGAFALLIGATFAAGPQSVGNSGKGFKAPLEYFDAPHERQMRSYLEGSESELLANGLVGLKDAKLFTYHEDGTLEMIANAPQCVYDTRQRTVSSTGELQVQTMDTGLAVWHRGVGFIWFQTNSDLKISNQVSTIIIGTPTNLFTP